MSKIHQANVQSHPTPLTVDLVARIVHDANPKAALMALCQPYKVTWAVKRTDTANIRACIDERQDVVLISHQIHPQAKTIEFQGNRLGVHINDVIGFENRETIPMSSLPAGAIGVISAALFARCMRTSTSLSQLSQGDDAVNRFIHETVDALPHDTLHMEHIPVHIDNKNGTVPIVVANDRGSGIHLNHVKQLLSSGVGCGAAANVFQTIQILLTLFGQRKRASELASALGIRILSDGTGVLPDQRRAHFSKLLVHCAISHGSDIDIYTGMHDAEFILFTFGDRTIDRVIVRANTHLEMFKSDLGEGRAYELLNTIFQFFQVDIAPLDYLIAVHLVTYILLGQHLKPRLYLPLG